METIRSGTTKTISLFYGVYMKRILHIFILLFITISCKKENDPGSFPDVITYWPYPVRCTSVVSGGEITSDGDSPVIDCGICWGENENPTLSDNYISAETVTDTFRITITGLEPDTDYYMRAYATNDAGTAYGENKSFTTCLDINSDPVNPVTMTLYDKPLDTIKKYIEGKWRIVVVKGGAAGIYMCYNDFYAEFTSDNTLITNVYMIETDTFLIDWVEQYYMGITTFRIELDKSAFKYIVRELKNDSLIYREHWDDALYYYGIKEK
jgi:hypothetical protein